MNRAVELPSCPVCKSTQTHLFFAQHDVPTRAGVLAPTREEALSSELGDITLQHCRSCGHIWNSSFDPAKLGFDLNYEFSQFHSAVYRDYVDGSMQRLKSRYGLAGKTALDIGCGKGEYLRMLLDAGIAKGIGFDQTFVEGVLSEAERQRITIHRRNYGVEDRAIKPDLVTCRSVLQYIPNPGAFLSSIRETLDGQFDTVVCFEVPNAAEPFREKHVWHVMYEAGCFFSAASLARLFRECGFQVLDVLSALGDSQLEIEAQPSASPQVGAWESAESLAEIEREVEGFAAEYESQANAWSERFDSYRRDGKCVVLWAAGMRAISLLTNVAPASAMVEYVVDVNPHRTCRFLPKTGQRVIAPEELLMINPDVVIATNPNYAPEIEAQVRALELRCDFEVLQ